MTTRSSTTKEALEPCPWCKAVPRALGHYFEVFHPPTCFFAEFSGALTRKCIYREQFERWNSYARITAPIVAPEVDEKDDAFIFRHGADCAWERTTSEECEYKDTHNYCPHPEHACTCPQISGELSDNPTLEEAEAYLRAHGVTLEDAANAFIERLLEQNLRLKQEVAALRNQAGPRRCVNCNHADTYLGRDGRCRAVVLGPDAMQGSGMAHCGCKCEFATTPPSTLAKAAAAEIANWLNWKGDVHPAAHQQNIVSITAIIERCLAGGGESGQSDAS